MAIDQLFVGLPSTNLGRAGAGGHPCQGIYHTPAGKHPKVAVIATHYQIDFSEHYMAQYLAERGIGFLGWNTRFRGREAHFLPDHALVDIGVGVRWLKEQAGVEQVILLGNSGGGSLMAAYQSQAVKSDLVPLEGMHLADGLDDLLAADGYISVAAHLGRPDVLTNWMDGSVIDETRPFDSDPELDLFNPENGPPFSEAFVTRYRQAQKQRNHRITRWVKTELRKAQAAGYRDRFFSLTRTWADPRMVDPSIEPTQREPNACYAGKPEKANKSVFGIAGSSTLRTWLVLWSLEDSQIRAQRHLPKITVPALIMNGNQDTGVFPSDAQAVVDTIGATDKEFHEVDADHYFLVPGARDTQADLISEWIGRKFS